jgi:ParB family transcriptional regulator, chromosome partitioning protein
MKTKRPAMGRGLGALLDSTEIDITTKREIVKKYSPSNFAMIPLDNITTNPFQPRTVFEEKALTELVESIRAQGIIQPVTVRMVGDDKYQLISGGRRLKASKMAGLTEIPAYIRTADDMQMLQMGLVENIQREDLDPIEIAISFQMLIEECKLTHEALSQNIGKNRTTITNYLRLLKLPAEIQIALRKNRINMGHARALINIDTPAIQLKLFNEIIKHDLSVRKVENLVRNLAINKTEKISNEKEDLSDNTMYTAIQDNIGNLLDTKIELKRNNKGRGTIVIRFTSDEELQRIVDFLNK